VDIKLLKEYTKDLTVLIVDDELGILNSIALQFSKIFKKIYKASNGIEAIKVLKNFGSSIDIVFSDISMPKLNGIGLVYEIKELNFPQKIIMISAYSDSGYFLELINLGVDGFILKPINVEQLYNQIYKISKTITEAKMVTAYQSGLERYMDTIMRQSIKLSKSDEILKSIIMELDNNEIRRLLKIAQKHNNDISPILRNYTIKRREQKIFIKEFEEEKQKIREVEIEEEKKLRENIDIPNKKSAISYLDEIEYSKYFADVQDELLYLEELSTDIYDVLQYEDIDSDKLKRCGELYIKYSNTLFKFSEFDKLANAVSELGAFYKSVDIDLLFSKIDEKSFKNMTLFFITDLENWKNSVFIKKNSIDIHYLDEQAKSTANYITTLIKADEGDGEDDDDTIMLF